MQEDALFKGELLIDADDVKARRAILLLAHGAGAPMDSDFMNELSGYIEQSDIAVIRFEFPYMHERRLTGKKRPPDRAPKLLQCFREAIILVKQRFPDVPLFIGGKSMGGRMASMISAEPQTKEHIKGCACFGYPYHAPGKPEKVRNEHFAELCVPLIVLQGDRDAFGTKSEIESYAVFDSVQHEWLLDGNHDFKPRKAAGITQQENIQRAAHKTADWIMDQL